MRDFLEANTYGSGAAIIRISIRLQYNDEWKFSAINYSKLISNSVHSLLLNVTVNSSMVYSSGFVTIVL